MTAKPAEPGMRPGVRLGIDVGSVRVGVARSDATGAMAVPVVTLKRGKGDLVQIQQLVAEYEALEVLVGLPLSLSGKRGPAAETASQYAVQVAELVQPVPVRLVDERLSTVEAGRNLAEAGKTTRQGRSVVDQAAAVIIVEHALAAERQSGEPAGTTVRIP